MEIRPASLSDLGDVTAIREAAISCHGPAVYSQQEVDELLRQLDEPDLRAMVVDRRLFVAERVGLVVGTAGWTADYLRHVHVRPGNERTGIGARLIREVEQALQRQGNHAAIHVNATRNAELFYAANGYERFSAKDAVSRLLIPMRKQLVPNKSLPDPRQRYAHATRRRSPAPRNKPIDTKRLRCVCR